MKPTDNWSMHSRGNDNQVDRRHEPVNSGKSAQIYVVNDALYVSKVL